MMQEFGKMVKKKKEKVSPKAVKIAVVVRSCSESIDLYSQSFCAFQQ